MNEPNTACRRFEMVDVFAGQPLSGNPLPVVEEDGDIWIGRQVVPLVRGHVDV